MSKFSDQVGLTACTQHYRIDSDRVDAFRNAIESNCKKIPPTYVTIFRDGEFELLDKLKIPLNQILHAEQEYEYIEDLILNENYTVQTVFVKCVEKKGKSGRMAFLTFESRINLNEKTVLISKSHMVFREKS
ncbi:MAG: hypothetical protein CL678_18000 [Bdellovibrionaceae bacterium]|nr:hypothetical protein [Pseudobdellovibrionaceae bacterium]|tara:strand:- start:585 stop:980 length:396 start_codon:yes stop_codon:yes gene_type:complete